MRLADTRPPFAGLANLSWEALASLPTPCYLLDEGQLRRNGELLLGGAAAHRLQNSAGAEGFFQL